MLRNQNSFRNRDNRDRDRDSRDSRDTRGGGGKGKSGGPGDRSNRNPRAPRRVLVKFNLPKDAKFDYKNLSLLQRFLNDRGKLIPRRITGITAKDQRQLNRAIRQARFLALLPTGGVK